MMKRYLLPATPIAAMLLLTGCIDDNYDLDNIDTTTEVSVNGLVIPVNVNDVTLKNLIDIGEDDDIQAIGEGENSYYAYQYPNPKKQDAPDNTFTSDGKLIDPFEVKANDIDPTNIKVVLDVPGPAQVKRAPSEVFSYRVPDRIITPFDFDVKDIDGAVTRIDKLGTPDNNPLVFKVRIVFPTEIASVCESMTVETLKIHFPEGLNGRASIGQTVNDVVTITNEPIDIIEESGVTLGLLAFDVKSTDININKEFEGEGPHNFIYAKNIVVEEGGTLNLTFKDGVMPANEFTITNNYALNNFTITRFTGGIDYKIDSVNIDPISLESLPDFLTESEQTKLIINNPQLYLALNNPVAKYGLEPTTSIVFKQELRNGEVSAPAYLELKDLTIYSQQGSNAVYRYAISPKGSDLNVPTNVTALSEYSNDANLHKTSFPGLSQILDSEEGIPNKLLVELDPVVKGDVTEFELGVPLDGVNGSYQFFAPLALDKDSKIFKTGTETDWSSEDLDRLYVKELQLTTLVSSDIPFDVKVNVEVRNIKGEAVGKSNTVTIPANSPDHQFEFTVLPVSGEEFNDIDGIYYDVTCEVTKEDAKALSPEQKLVLKDVRAKVNGYYLYKDDDK